MNRGAAELSKVGTITDISQRLDTSQTAVKQWIAGKTVPTPRFRTRIESVLGVPYAMWDLPVEGIEMAVKPSSPPDTDDPIERAKLQLRRLDAMRANGVISTGQALQLERVETHCLANLAKLRGDNVTIDAARLAKTPAFKTLLCKMFDAMLPWPDAIRAVQKVLEDESQ